MSANLHDPHEDWDEFARQHVGLLAIVLPRVVGNAGVVFEPTLRAPRAPSIELLPDLATESDGA
jgi:hypothetical protein